MSPEPGIKLVESVDLFSHLANVGDVRSLIHHPASTTHRQLTDEQLIAAGAGPDGIRLSIGLESVEDLMRIWIRGWRRFRGVGVRKGGWGLVLGLAWRCALVAQAV